MFLFRSVFWLTLAFVMIRPDANLGQSAEAAASEAMARGSQMVAEQIAAIECTDLQCHGGKALAAAALGAVPQPEVAGVPLPRPRPAHAS
jgi:hypothetical protein